jgi:hypothetical protein
MDVERAHVVIADLDVQNSGRKSYFSARNEALRSAEQQLMNENKNNGRKSLNIFNQIFRWMVQKKQIL